MAEDYIFLKILWTNAEYKLSQLLSLKYGRLLYILLLKYRNILHWLKTFFDRTQKYIPKLKKNESILLHHYQSKKATLMLSSMK